MYSFNLVSLFEDTVSKFPQAEAVVFEETRLTYQNLNEEINRLGHALIKLGLKRGEKVVLMAPNDHHFVIAYYAILKAGGIVVPVNILFHGEELKYILDHSEASMAIIFNHYEARLAEIKASLPYLKTIISFGEPHKVAFCWDSLIADSSSKNIGLEPEDEEVAASSEVAAIIYTSGTTGRPKGAMLTHFNLTSNLRSIRQALGSTKTEIMLCLLPLFHAFGATVSMLLPLSSGFKVVIMSRFHPHQVLTHIAQERVTFFAGVPPMYAMLSQAEHLEGLDLSSWRLAISGGAALPLEIMRRFEERFSIPIYEGDGPTECSPVTSINPIGGIRKPGSIGVPIPEVEMRIMDDKNNFLPPGEIGEIVVKGPNVMKGYFRDPAATAEAIVDGWLHTGDVGKMDEEGYFYILDRKKDMVNVGGFNVYPREVEEVIYTNPKIAEVAVVAIPDRKGWRGEIPKAFVVLNEGMEMTDHELIQYCHKRLASFKVPRQVEFCASLPKTATGKIQKVFLRQQEWQKK